MSQNILFPVKSRADVDFTEALAENAASAMVTLYGVEPIFSRRYFIRAIRVTAKENFGPQLNFFASAAGDTTEPSTNTFLGRWGFAASMGTQIGATGLWQYYIDGLAIPYYDEDTILTTVPPNLHVILENISATAKSADADGAVTVEVWMQPMTTAAN